MKINLDKYAINRLSATLSAEVLLGWESGVHFRQHGRYFSWDFSSELHFIFENFIQYDYRLKFFEFPLLSIFQDLTNFYILCYIFYCNKIS